MRLELVAGQNLSGKRMGQMGRPRDIVYLEDAGRAVLAARKTAFGLFAL